MSQPNRYSPVYLSALGMTCAAGDGVTEVMDNLRAGTAPGMVKRSQWTGEPLTVGEVAATLPSLESFGVEYRSRNNQLALHTSRQIETEILRAREEFGPRRVAVIIGTTTSGMAETEAAFAFAKTQGNFPDTFVYSQQELGSPAEFLARAWELKGPTFTVSTACSSSAKALAIGRRLLRLGICDAVLAGGVDTLCSFTLRGFSALGALSPELCLPFSPNRKGINIGEAAAFFLMRRDDGPVRLLGVGETSDAHNISAPLPGGEGAEAAMRLALQDGKVAPQAVDYVNLHGTGTPQNDAMEARALRNVFSAGVPCSSTKPFTGHTLGAAGALEAGICWALLNPAAGDRHTHATSVPWLPAQLNDGVMDPDQQPLQLVRPNHHPAVPPQNILSNVFGFGGTNVSLLLGTGA